MTSRGNRYPQTQTQYLTAKREAKTKTQREVLRNKPWHSPVSPQTRCRLSTFVFVNRVCTRVEPALTPRWGRSATTLYQGMHLRGTTRPRSTRPKNRFKRGRACMRVRYACRRRDAPCLRGLHRAPHPTVRIAQIGRKGRKAARQECTRLISS